MQQQMSLSLLRHPLFMQQTAMLAPPDMTFLSQTRFCIAALQLTGMLRAANDSAINLLGLRPEDMQVGPHQLSLIGLTHPEDVSAAFQDLHQLLKRQQVSIFATRRLRSRQGTYVPVNLVTCLQSDTAGTIVGYECCFIPA